MLDALDKEIEQTFTEAAASGQKEVLRLFLDSEIDMTPYLHTALKKAARHGHLAIVEMLITSIMNMSLMAKAPIEDRIAHIGHTLVGGCTGGHRDIVSLGLSMVNQDLVATETATQQPVMAQALSAHILHLSAGNFAVDLKPQQALAICR